MKVVYTDGACSGNPGPGGWAWALVDGGFASGAEAHTTNQRMEITAAFEAVSSNDGPLEVVSDSTYVVNCFRDHWWEGWERRGWLNSQRKPVANRDLWEPFVDLYKARRNVRFRWVKGHGGDPMNDLVDRLAVQAALEQQGRSGESTPDDLGAPDRRGGRRLTHQAAIEAPLPGHPLVVLGHRPVELGGYGPNPLADRVLSKLTEILAAKHAMERDLVVVTGLRLGAEMLGAQAAVAAGVPYMAVLPYPNPDKVWPDERRALFSDLLDDAVDVLTLEDDEPRSRREAGESLARRDAWLARHAREAVIVWDGSGGPVAESYRSLVTVLGDDVWVVDPNELV